MKKIFLLSLFSLSISLTTLYAENVNLETAKKTGEKFIKESTVLGAEKSSVNAILAYTLSSSDGNPCIYVFNIENDGFVIVSAEDRIKPILAYSTEGPFNNSDIADGFQYTLFSYREEIEYIRDNNIAVTQDIVKEWESVKNTGRINSKKNNRTVAPLLETTWNQNYPYNSLCPEDSAGDGGHVYAGCVATAMAQVMKYYNHPVHGTGSHSYTPGGWGFPSYPTQYANFGETYYNFELMPAYLDSTSTEDEIYYIALYLWHCGISVDMMYGPDGSGAFSESVTDAASRYFGFNPRMKIRHYWNYNNETWGNLLRSELDSRHPVYYSGQDDNGNGGHAFVCDGYDENDFFHFNWGWGGRDDGFFAIGALNTTKYAFNTLNSAIEGFYPAQESDYYYRPARVTDFTVTELDSNDGAVLSWTNPTDDINANPLSSLDSVIIRRDFLTIAAFGNISPGQTMTYNDTVDDHKVYEYSVYVKNSYGNSIPVYESLMVGPKCNIIFDMNDEGGDGWKGGSISVVNNGNRIAVVTLKDGSHETQTVPLLQGDLRFIWNKCWYSGEYFTGDEISFTIYDADTNELFNSPDSLITGYLFSYENDCKLPMTCARPNHLQGEYYWKAGEFGAKLNWELNADNLQKFNIYRSEDNINYNLIAEVIADEGDGNYEYFDNVEINTYYYKVTAYYERDGETCESNPALSENGENFVMVEVTSLNEYDVKVSIYPNPTNGMIRVESGNIVDIVVYNIVGQKVRYLIVKNDFCNLDLSNLNEGVYFIKINTENGVVTKKIILSCY